MTHQDQLIEAQAELIKYLKAEVERLKLQVSIQPTIPWTQPMPFIPWYAPTQPWVTTSKVESYTTDYDNLAKELDRAVASRIK